MRGFGGRWWVAGGHALELHLGRSWRRHGDVDIGLCRQDVPRLRAPLAEWEVFVAAAGELEPWDGAQVSAERAENNLWVRRPGGSWRLDVTVGEGDEHEWVYRRDPAFRVPWSLAVLHGPDGVPYLAPALQLLFKSKAVRPKDRQDAQVVIPELDPWSLDLLDARLQPDHPWRRLVAARRNA